MKKKLPVGIESFEEFFKENFYYIDKTMFIAVPAVLASH